MSAIIMRMMIFIVAAAIQRRAAGREETYFGYPGM